MEKPVNSKYLPVKAASDKERIGMVKEIFSTITGKYDFLNHFLSARRDVAWRRFAVNKMIFSKKGRFLDVACGTGDLSIGTALSYPHIQVAGTDFVNEMMQVGKKKIKKQKLTEKIHFSQGDALHLPFRDNCFDVAGMAFGIRNIPDRSRALKEMLRVIIPGGQVMVLEMTFIQNKFFKAFYYIYLNYLLPLFAKIFTKNPAAYHYLADSIMNFPSPDEFAILMEHAGMVNVEKYPLTFGIAYLHIGKKPVGADNEQYVS